MEEEEVEEVEVSSVFRSFDIQLMPFIFEWGRVKISRLQGESAGVAIRWNFLTFK